MLSFVVFDHFRIHFFLRVCVCIATCERKHESKKRKIVYIWAWYTQIVCDLVCMRERASKNILWIDWKYRIYVRNRSNSSSIGNTQKNTYWESWLIHSQYLWCKFYSISKALPSNLPLDSFRFALLFSDGILNWWIAIFFLSLIRIHTFNSTCYPFCRLIWHHFRNQKKRREMEKIVYICEAAKEEEREEEKQIFGNQTSKRYIYTNTHENEMNAKNELFSVASYLFFSFILFVCVWSQLTFRRYFMRFSFGINCYC